MVWLRVVQIISLTWVLVEVMDIQAQMLQHLVQELIDMFYGLESVKTSLMENIQTMMESMSSNN